MKQHTLPYAATASLIFVAIYFIFPAPWPYMLVFFGMPLIGFLVIQKSAAENLLQDRRDALIEGLLTSLLIGISYVCITGAANYSDFAASMEETEASSAQVVLLFLISYALLLAMLVANGVAGTYLAAVRAGLLPRGYVRRKPAAPDGTDKSEETHPDDE